MKSSQAHIKKNHSNGTWHYIIRIFLYKQLLSRYMNSSRKCLFFNALFNAGTRFCHTLLNICSKFKTCTPTWIFRILIAFFPIIDRFNLLFVYRLFSSFFFLPKKIRSGTSLNIADENFFGNILAGSFVCKGKLDYKN